MRSIKSLVKTATYFYIGQIKRNLESRLSKHSRCVNNQEIYKSSIAKHCWSAGHNFNFIQTKIIFKPNRISELDIFENIAIHLNHEVIINEKIDSIDSIILSTAWKNLFSANNHSSLNSDN